MDAMGGFPANDWGDGDEGGGQEVWEADLLLDATRAVAAAEEAARQAEQRFREALDALPQGIVFLDAEGRYIHWNEEYARIYHRSADLFRRGRGWSTRCAKALPGATIPKRTGARRNGWPTGSTG
jgi:PAS domain-containing protein